MHNMTYLVALFVKNGKEAIYTGSNTNYTYLYL